MNRSPRSPKRSDFNGYNSDTEEKVNNTFDKTGLIFEYKAERWTNDFLHEKNIKSQLRHDKESRRYKHHSVVHIDQKDCVDYEKNLTFLKNMKRMADFNAQALLSDCLKHYDSFSDYKFKILVAELVKLIRVLLDSNVFMIRSFLCKAILKKIEELRRQTESLEEEDQHFYITDDTHWLEHIKIILPMTVTNDSPQGIQKSLNYLLRRFNFTVASLGHIVHYFERGNARRHFTKNPRLLALQSGFNSASLLGSPVERSEIRSSSIFRRGSGLRDERHLFITMPVANALLERKKAYEEEIEDEDINDSKFRNVDIYFRWKLQKWKDQELDQVKVVCRICGKEIFAKTVKNHSINCKHVAEQEQQITHINNKIGEVIIGATKEKRNVNMRVIVERKALVALRKQTIKRRRDGESPSSGFLSSRSPSTGEKILRRAPSFTPKSSTGMSPGMNMFSSPTTGRNKSYSVNSQSPRNPNFRRQQSDQFSASTTNMFGINESGNTPQLKIKLRGTINEEKEDEEDDNNKSSLKQLSLKNASKTSLEGEIDGKDEKRERKDFIIKSSRILSKNSNNLEDGSLSSRELDKTAVKIEPLVVNSTGYFVTAGYRRTAVLSAEIADDIQNLHAMNSIKKSLQLLKDMNMVIKGYDTLINYASLIQNFDEFTLETKIAFENAKTEVHELLSQIRGEPDFQKLASKLWQHLINKFETIRTIQKAKDEIEHIETSNQKIKEPKALKIPDLLRIRSATSEEYQSDTNSPLMMRGKSRFAKNVGGIRKVKKLRAKTMQNIHDFRNVVFNKGFRKMYKKLKRLCEQHKQKIAHSEEAGAGNFKARVRMYKNMLKKMIYGTDSVGLRILKIRSAEKKITSLSKHSKSISPESRSRSPHRTMSPCKTISPTRSKSPAGRSSIKRKTTHISKGYETESSIMSSDNSDRNFSDTGSDNSSDSNSDSDSQASDADSNNQTNSSSDSDSLGNEDDLDYYPGKVEHYDKAYFSDDPQNMQKYAKNNKGVSALIGVDDFKFVKLISKGAYGRVWLVQRKVTGDYYAMKVINFCDIMNRNHVESIRKEKEIFELLEGDFVVKAIFTFVHHNYLCVVMEFQLGGDFGNILEKHGALEERVAKFYIAEVVIALSSLHSLGIVHRDLKPDNILLNKHGHIKLTDFGLSEIGIKNHAKGKNDHPVENFLDSRMRCSVRDDPIKRKFSINKQGGDSPKRIRMNNRIPTFKEKKPEVPVNTNGVRIVGTPDYIAPEVIHGQCYDGPSIDWWSVGVLLFEFIVGIPPFNDPDIDVVFDNIINKRIPWDQISIGYDEGEVTPEAKDLIDKLLELDRTKRIGTNNEQDIKNHPFFKGIDWNNLLKSTAPIIPEVENETDLTNFHKESLKFHEQELLTPFHDKDSSRHSSININLDNFQFARLDILHEENQKLLSEAHEQTRRSTVRDSTRSRKWSVFEN